MTEPFNAAAYLTERRVAAGDADRVALRHPGGTHTYGRLTEDVRRVAGGLAAIGVRPEERVLLCMADDIELATAILAAMYLGAVAVPCSTMLTGGELGKLVVDSRARVLVGSEQFATAVTAAAAGAPDLRHVVLTGDTAPVIAGVTGLTWDALRAAEPLAGALRLVGRVARAVALHLRDHGHTQGRDAPPRRHPLRVRDLRPPGARRRPRRRLPLGRQAVLRLRPRQQPAVPAVGGRERGAGAVAALPRALRRADRRARRHPVLRRPELLGPARSRPTCRGRRSRPSATASRRARPCPRACSTPSRSGTASRSSTASAPPRRCTSSSPTSRARSCPAARVSPCPATASSCAAPTAR